MTRGFIKAAKEGKPMGGKLYGLDRAYYDEKGQLMKTVSCWETFSKPQGWTSKYVPSKVPGTVETVRWIFETFFNSERSVMSIACELNEKGVPPKNGDNCHSQNIRCMLKNRVYVGDFVYGKRTEGKFHRIGNNGEITDSSIDRPVRLSESPIVVENTHEALIDRETFHRVQEKFAERTFNHRKVLSSPYILTGVIRCGLCGSLMVGGSNGSSKNCYYACNSIGSKVVCEYLSVRKDSIEFFVLNIIADNLLSDENLDRLKDSVIKHAKGRAIDQAISAD